MNTFKKWAEILGRAVATLTMTLCTAAGRIMKSLGTGNTAGIMRASPVPTPRSSQVNSMLQRHVVVVGEGGGARIIFISAMLEYIETQLKQHLVDWADLAVSTSASSVIFSLLTTDRVSAAEFNQLLLNGLLKDMFTPEGPLAIPRYSRDPYVDEYKKTIGDPVYMNESLIELIMTSFSTCGDGITHFFKSWEDKDGKMKMTDATCRSFAAPYFFGELQDDKNRTFWGDGGLGINNMPAWYAYGQARKNGWLNPGHHTHFLLLGSGYSQYSLDFEQAKKGGEVKKLFEQGLNYMNLSEGGLAKASSTVEQARFMQFIASTYDTAGVTSGAMTVDYVNWEGMPKDLDKMDDWKDAPTYYAKGLEFAKKIDLDALRKAP